MPQPLNGPGNGLPLPTYLYPSELYNAPYDTSTNELTLEPGEAITLPAGDWYVGSGNVSMVQFQDPISGTWRGHESARTGMQFVKSDGFNARIANLTGCMIGAIVVAGGSGYTQAKATVTASAGNSTWQPIVGGQCSVVTVTGAAGLTYTQQPLVFIPAPPSPGIPATAVALLTGGTVSSVSLTNVGAGYTTAPTALILPSPYDPSPPTSNPTVTLGLVGAGSITGVLCTNAGSPVTSLPTLTAGGGTVAASIVAVQLTTVTSVVVTGAGSGYGSAAEITTVGGQPAGTPQWVNPAFEFNLYRPRKASIGATLSAGSITGFGTIYDGGLFAGTPTALVV